MSRPERKCMVGLTVLICVFSIISHNQVLASSECEVGYRTSYAKDYENPKGVCSNNGECKNNTCICETGYTGLSDFINTEFDDCQIQILVYQIEWGILLGLHIVSQIYSVPKFIRRYKDHKSKNIPFRKNRGLVAITIYQVLVAPCLTIMCIAKIVDDTQRVGVTLLVTILFFLNKLGLYACAAIYQTSLIATSLRGTMWNKRERVEKLIRISNAGAIMNFISSSLLGLLPLVTYFTGGEATTAEVVWIFYLIGSVLTLTPLGLQQWYIKIKIKEMFQNIVVTNESSTQLKATLETLIKLENSVIIQVVLNNAIYLAFCFVPDLWNKHDYYLPASWLVFPILCKNTADTYISSDETTRKGSKDVIVKTQSKNKTETENTFEPASAISV